MRRTVLCRTPTFTRGQIKLSSELLKDGWLLFNIPPQDDALLQAVFASQLSTKVVTVNSFRGARKSTCAARLELRSRIIPFRCGFRLYRIHHVENATSLQILVTSPSLKSGFSWSGTAVSYIWGVFWGTGVVVCMWSVMKLLKWTSKGLQETIWDELPSGYSLGTAVIGALLLGLLPRRAYIVDDLMRYTFQNTVPKHECVTTVLGDLKSAARKCPVVVLSSNEGLDMFFSDKNPSTYERFVFPAPDKTTLARALNNTDEMPPRTEEEVQKVFDRFGEGGIHHCASMRWWLITNGDEKAINDRSVLREVSLKLDLAAEPTGRMFALGYSEKVDVSSFLKGYTHFSAEDVKMIVAEIGTVQPRRMVLTCALLVTGRNRAVEQQSSAVEQQLQKMEKWIKEQSFSMQKEAPNSAVVEAFKSFVPNSQWFLLLPMVEEQWLKATNCKIQDLENEVWALQQMIVMIRPTLVATEDGGNGTDELQYFIEVANLVRGSDVEEKHVMKPVEEAKTCKELLERLTRLDAP